MCKTLGMLALLGRATTLMSALSECFAFLVQVTIVSTAFWLMPVLW